MAEKGGHWVKSAGGGMSFRVGSVSNSAALQTAKAHGLSLSKLPGKGDKEGNQYVIRSKDGRMNMRARSLEDARRMIIHAAFMQADQRRRMGLPGAMGTFRNKDGSTIQIPSTRKVKW